ncbi:regulator of G-protein signaling [Acrasis kona]|uniref:Regulator of G-protein signaling n=1 Tax=Acrasis kona TaxID=1008807 RepID=A0AAW2YRN7_9EUKA
MSWIKRNRISITNRFIPFENVFSNQVLRDHFYSFLKRSFNDDGFSFLLAKEKYDAEANVEKKLEMLHDMLDTYIKEGCQREVNVDAKSRRDAEGAINECILKKTPPPDSLLEEISEIIFRELRNDSFARYQRSEGFLDLIDSQGLDFINSISHKEGDSQTASILFSSQDFNQKTINDSDIKLIFRLCEDSADWVAMRRSKKGEVERDLFSYVSKSVFRASDGTQIKLAKLTGIVPYSAEQTLHALVRKDLRKLWDSNEVRNNAFAYNSEGDYSVTVQDYAMTLIPVLMKKRQAIKMSTVLYDTNRKCFLYACKTTEAFQFEQDPKAVQMHFYFGVAIYNISESRCRYVYTLYYQYGKPGSHDSEFTFRLSMKQKSKAMHEGIIKACDIQKKNDFKRPENSNSALETLDDFKKKYLSTTGSQKTWDIEDL